MTLLFEGKVCGKVQKHDVIARLLDQKIVAVGSYLGLFCKIHTGAKRECQVLGIVIVYSLSHFLAK